jgi:putative ABC transport system permease protein
MMKWITQVISVAGFSLQTIPERKGSSLAAVFGLAGVVAVLVGVLSIAQGITHMAEVSAAPENVIVLRSGADTEMMSGFSSEDVKTIAETPNIARSKLGPIASSELFVIINLPKRTTGTDANVPLRGVTPPAFEVRDRFKITQGRMFGWGLNEVIAGDAAAREFDGLEVGSTLEVGDDEWPVVGIFSTDGGIAEGEVWADAAIVQAGYRRGNSYQSVYAKLASSESFRSFKDTLTSDPRLNVKVVRERNFYAEQSTTLRAIVTGLGVIIAGLMGLGAIFGALNTMYTAVAARTREIATLRALGFRASPVLVSVLFEALVLALAGGAIGGGIAYFAFDGFKTATMNWQTFSQIAFAFDVDSTLMIRGIVYAALIGFIGGLLPAIRAARLPVATALRES